MLDQPSSRGGPNGVGPPVAYCGFTDTANIGDYALYLANRSLFPRLDLVPGRDSGPVEANLFGGGTLFPHSLRSGWYRRRRTNVAIGIGVAEPGRNGRFSLPTLLTMHWWRFRRIGVRGPRSLRTLQAHHLRADVTGDTAIALEAGPAERSSGDAVLICLVGESMIRRGNSSTVMDHVVRYGQRLRAEGLRVAVAPFCRTDVDASHAFRRAVGDDVEVWDFWSGSDAESLDRFLARIAGARFVVAERLHAAVLAAVANVPFVILPYKSKCLDFAETLTDAPGLVLNYEQLSGESLWRSTHAALTAGQPLRDQVADSVVHLRARLRSFASEAEHEILAAAKRAG